MITIFVYSNSNANYFIIYYFFIFTQVKRGENFNDKANAATTGMFIVDTTEMNPEEVVPMVHDGQSTHLMSKFFYSKDLNEK